MGLDFNEDKSIKLVLKKQKYILLGMKYLSTILLLLPLCAGCSSDWDIDHNIPTGKKAQIGFSSRMHITRADATLADIQTNGFSVWGGYEGYTVFDGREVKYSNSEWNYNNPEYWTYNTYNFYAVYPKNTEANYANGTFTISDYKVNNTEDLLCASATHTYPNNGTTVTFGFKHLLAKVSIELKKDREKHDSDEIVVTSVSLNGMYMQGNYVSSQETETWADLENSSSLSKDINKELSTNYEVVLDECMMIPQVFSDEHQVYLVVNYTFDQGGDNDNLSTKSLITPLPIEYKWDINTHIVYKATITVDHNIEFATPVVEEWGTEQAGGTIIIT